MALLEEPKHVAVKMIQLYFNCNYLIESCVRLCSYIYIYIYMFIYLFILLIIEHSWDVSPENSFFTSHG